MISIVPSISESDDNCYLRLESGRHELIRKTDLYFKYLFI